MPQLVIEKIPEMSNAYKETLRGIRTNIQFCGSDVKCILFSSVTPNEGKTMTSFNVAKAFAENGKKVLYLDTDIRKSVISSKLGCKTVDNSRLVGLTHYLSGQYDLDNILYTTNINNLYMIFAGPNVPNATEILDSAKFRNLVKATRSHFDYIIIDSAPVTAAIDSSLISKECDGTVLVLVPEENNTRIINKCRQQLQASGTKILGVILNKVEVKKNSYYGKYYGSYYGKYYGNDGK